MSKDVRKEQLVLLKFEKKIASLAAFVAAGSATAASASEKMGGDASAVAYDQIRQALVNLAEVTSNAHVVLEQTVAQAGLKSLDASGGVPKDPPTVEMVRSLLGLG
jgi:xanthine dehydrogenase molybdopterin-binding subunit B